MRCRTPVSPKHPFPTRTGSLIRRNQAPLEGLPISSAQSGNVR